MKSKIIMILYIIPYIYIGMMILWINNSFAVATLFTLVVSVPLLLAFICGKNKQKKTLIWGNIISEIISFFLVWLTNNYNITNELGGTWRGHFKPFYSEQFVIVMFVISVLLQCFIYMLAKPHSD